MTSPGPVPAGRGLSAGYAIRPFRDDDVATLCAVEWRAGQAFAEHGFSSLAAEPQSEPAEFRARFAGARLVVAVGHDDMPVGFAAMLDIGDHVWLAELSVDPAHGRKGVGSALLDAVALASSNRGLAGVALSTFRDVPFNAPFYRRHGYVDVRLDQAPAPLAARFASEIPPGTNPDSRVLMIRTHPNRV